MGADHWVANGCKMELSRDRAKKGEQSLRLLADFPATAEVYCRAGVALSGLETVEYNVFVPSGAPTIKSLFYVKNKDGLWFQYLNEEPLAGGRWNKVEIDVSDDSTSLVPHGHFSRWNRHVASQMTVLGMKFLSDASKSVPIYLDDIDDTRRRRRKGSTPELSIVNYSENAKEVECFAKFEATFELSYIEGNPFDPDEIAVDAFFVWPSGKVHSVPGFYYQDFVRSQSGPEEVLTPVGKSCWKVRFTPTEAGTYSYYIQVVMGEDKIATSRRSFRAVPSKRRGFVRVAKDKRYFEFDNGEFFYVIGHNVRSPAGSQREAKIINIDVPPDRGTYAYDDFFRKMSENGENLAEVWMCSWWLGVEWVNDWKSYHGLGKYNLHNAWKLDYVLDLARKRDLYVHLVIDNHGKASTFCDPEWEDSPYNLANGGFLESPEEMFSDRVAKALHRKKLRYIAARWAHCPRIMGFELWSELDLVGDSFNGFYRNASKHEWHKEMTEYLKKTDPWKHLVTTHYSTDWNRIDPMMARLQHIDYVVVDAYRGKGSIVPLIKTTYSYGFRPYNKPGFVTEYGGSPFGTTVPGLIADLHAGIWSTFMTPAAGTPLLWWFDFVDRKDHYFHYKALANYARGEDRRGKSLEMATPRLVADDADNLVHMTRTRAMSLQNRESCYAWVYDQQVSERMPASDELADDVVGLTLVVIGMNPGKYGVEIWDTYKGTIISTSETEAARRTVSVKLPTFKKDIALKIKAKKGK